MKKHLFIGLMLFISANTFAQIDKILGSWVEIRHRRLDTIDTGREIINQDPVAYEKGYKQLSSEYVGFSIDENLSGDYSYIDENEKLKITITKEQDFFWAISGNEFLQRITYDPVRKNYYITMPGHFLHIELIVKYDEVSNYLQFIRPVPGDIYIFYEFKRKK
ncbi:MAG TPA: hypothetical protein VIV55_03810 [Flavobacterium sp.]